MAENKSPLPDMLGIFNKLSIQQRMVITAIIVVTFILVGFVLYLFNQTNYATLYSNLESEDASEIVDYLNSQKIEFQLTDNGTTIQVPQEKVYEIRLMLAGRGIPNSGVIGYEIFDNNNLGMSDFMQKLNYKRALEGELSKTISEGQGIKSARVQIVIPEKSVFKDEQKEATASIVLTLSGNYDINKSTINAIQHLVAGSVEGLKPGNVTIIDTKGNLLSQKFDESPIALSESKQYETKRNLEQYLTSKAQSLLDNVLGYGNSIVKVNADIDFKQIERTSEIVDPESQTAISEQTIKTANAGTSISDSSAANTENTITNYELSKSIEKIMEGSGVIKRATIAVVVNGKKVEKKEGDKITTIVEPRSEGEIENLKTLVMQSVGFDATRNDVISIVSIPFENQLLDEQVSEATPLGDMDSISRMVMMILGVVASIFLLKGLLKKLKNERIEIGFGNGEFVESSFSSIPGLISGNAGALSSGGGGVPLLGQNATYQEGESGVQLAKKIPAKKRKAMMEVGDIEDEITDEALQKKVRRERIQNYVQKNPTEAAKLINSWLREDEY